MPWASDGLWYVGSMKRHLVSFLVCMVTACSPISAKAVKRAESSVYDAEFAVVYSAALREIAKSYPTYQEDAKAGTIATAWHHVRYANPAAEDRRATQMQNRAQGMTQAGNPMAGQSVLNKQYFVRFDVKVLGGRPWRVKVVAHAQELTPGNTLPVDLHGLAQPSWVQGRRGALVIGIHERLKAFAQQPKTAQPEAGTLVVKGDLPPAARKTLEELRAALDVRSMQGVRAALADTVVWSQTDPPSADVAMAMWQADGQTLALMASVIDTGCSLRDAEVVCQGAKVLRMKYLSGAWRVVAFY